MPNEMTQEEVETSLASATAVDSYEFRDEEDEDDYITATLYETKEGRLFRLVESTGMNSSFAGAGNIGEWLTDEEAKEWNKF